LPRTVDTGGHFGTRPCWVVLGTHA
jgi:hypothetical protein